MPERPEKTLSPAALGKIFQRQGLQPPRVLTLALTAVCNLVCSHCWVEAGPGGSQLELPEAELSRLLREFAALGGEGIRITGGEPLCHPAWLKALQQARALGFGQLALQTNATLLCAAGAADLAALDFSGLAIQISLDGAGAATHDRIRGEGTFAAAMSGLQHLIAAGLGNRMSLAFTEMRHNLQDFPQLLELAETLGVGAVSAGTLVTGGRAAEAQDQATAPATIDQYLALIDQFESDPLFRQRYRTLGNLTALEWWRGQPADSGCCRLVEQPYLTPGGRLYPCLMCHAEAFAVTGVLQKPLLAALTEGVALWAALQQTCRLRPSSINVCRSCPEQGVCAAGCPGRALGSQGDLQAPDDRCLLRQAVADKRRREKSS